MCRLLALFMCVLRLFPGTWGKTVTGVFKSGVARERNGQYITKFMFGGDSGLLVCRLDNAALAMEQEARLLLYPEIQTDLDSLSCSQKLTRAQFTIYLKHDEHNQIIPKQSSPSLWHVLYADRYTCQESVPLPSHPDVQYTILLFNPDSAGNPLDHFSSEEAGLHSFYFVLLLSYFVACCIYVQPLVQALRKGGPMHTVLTVLTVALALQGLSALCNYTHLSRYSRDGVGLPLMGSLAELWDMIAQVSMLFMLLSLCMGWTLSRRKPQSRPLQWEQTPTSTAVAVGAVITQGADGSGPGLGPVSDHLHRTEHSETRLLHQLHQGLFPLVLVSPGARLYVGHFQRPPERKGRHYRCNPLPIHIRSYPLSTFPFEIFILGSLLSVFCIFTFNHVPNQPQGALLRTYKVTVFEPRDIATSTRRKICSNGLVCSSDLAKSFRYLCFKMSKW